MIETTAPSPIGGPNGVDSDGPDRRPRRNSLWTAVAHTVGTSLASTIVGLATSVLVARAAGPEGKGSYDLALATAVLLSTVFGFSLAGGITFVVAKGIANLNRLLAIVVGFPAVQGLVVAGLLLALERTWLGPTLLGEGRGLQLLPPIAALVGLLSLIAYLRAVLVGWQRFVDANWRDLGWRVATLVAMLLAVWLAASSSRRVGAFDLIWAAVAAAAATAFVLLVTIVWGMPQGGPTTVDRSRSGIREAVGFSLPAYAGNVAQFLNYRLDLFLVGLFLGVGGVGLYALAVSLGQLLWIVSNAAAAVLFPRVSAAPSPQAAAAEAAQIARVALWLTVGGSAALAASATLLVPAVYGAAFRPSVEPLLWLLPGITAFSVTNVISAYVAGVGRPGLNAMVSLLGVAVTVPLDLLLIPRLGISGAALASTLSYSISTIATLVVFSRIGATSLTSALRPRRSDISMLTTFLQGLRSKDALA
jgi:O-antigen/teichoic acid export membrane protein